jgi:hypothetical protein
LDVDYVRYASLAAASLCPGPIALLAACYGPLQVPQLLPDCLLVAPRLQSCPRQPPGLEARRRTLVELVRLIHLYLTGLPGRLGTGLAIPLLYRP